MNHRYSAINYRYFIKLEQDLLFHNGAYFSSEYFRQLRLRLELEFNPQRFHFSRYLQALVAFRQKKYPTASRLFASVSPKEIPAESQYFLHIYQAITNFLLEKEHIHRSLQQLRETLPSEYYGYLLAKLMISLQPNPAHHSRIFYLRLQLSILLPKLRETMITAYLYFELGHFYLDELPNPLLAITCFEKAQSMLEGLPNMPLTLLTLKGLAFASSNTNNLETTTILYEQLVSSPLWEQNIDAFYYFMSIIDAITFFQKSYQYEKAHQLRPLLEDINNLKKSEQKVILQFSLACLDIEIALADLKNTLPHFAATIKGAETLLTSLWYHELFPLFQLNWLRLRGKIALRSHQFISAKNYFLDALRINQQTPNLQLQSALHHEVSQAFAALEQFENAIEHFEYFDALRHELVANQKNHALISHKSRYHDQTITNLLVQANTTYQQIYTQVITDPLTKLGNRQALANLEYQSTENQSLACAMIDLDYFKKYNDFYGHLAGDTLLKKFADLLRSTCPDYHLIRYGGEEFLIIAMDVSEVTFVTKLHQFQTVLQAAQIPHHGITAESTVTMSIGYSISATMKKLTTLIAEADTALYEAKATGRNRIIAADTSLIRSSSLSS